MELIHNKGLREFSISLIGNNRNNKQLFMANK